MAVICRAKLGHHLPFLQPFSSYLQPLRHHQFVPERRCLMLLGVAVRSLPHRIQIKQLGRPVLATAELIVRIIISCRPEIMEWDLLQIFTWIAFGQHLL